MAAGLGTRMKLSAAEAPGTTCSDAAWSTGCVGAVSRSSRAPFVVVCPDETGRSLNGRCERSRASRCRSARGTGDAVLRAAGARGQFEGDLLVLPGDTPLLTTELLEDWSPSIARQAAVTVLSFEPADPRRTAGSSGPTRDGSRNRRGGRCDLGAAAVREVNSSVYVFAPPALWAALERLQPKNAQGEFYLTDAVRRIVEAGETAAAYRRDEWL